MSHLIAYIDDHGNLKVEDSNDWEDGLNIITWDDLVEEDISMGSQWLKEHEEDIAGLAGVEANGKGDTYRPVDKEKFNKGYDEVYGVQPKHVCRKFVKDPQDGSSKCYNCGEPEIGKFSR